MPSIAEQDKDKKFCPYLLRVEQQNQYKYEYEDGLTSFYLHKLIETQYPMECLKEQCAVYVDGKCTKV